MYPMATAHALTLLALLTLAACGGGGGSSNSAGTIEAVAPPPEPVFTIVGSVDASLDAGASIFVDLAGQRFSTTTDSQGRYELEVDSSASDSLVSLNAQGKGEQDMLILASALGDLKSLESLAGNDARLTADELAAVDVTPLTTAAVGLAMIENNGGLPSSFDELRSHSLNVNSEEMLIASAALELAVSDPSMQSMMLSGDASTMDLVTSVDRLYHAVSSIQSEDASKLSNAKMDTLSKASTNLASRPSGLDQLFIYEPGYRSSAFKFFDDGTGIEFTNARLGEEFFTWTQSGDEVVVTYEDWIVDGRIVLIDTDDDGVEEEVYEETVRKSTTLTFVAEGEATTS